MELISVRTKEAPSGRVRVTGTVAYDDRPGQTEDYWFEFPSEFAGSLSATGSPWLTCLLPMAAGLGEPLRLPLPVDPLLARNAPELMAIWRSWYPHLSVSPIHAPSEREEVGRSGRRTAMFFSGGVDSFFTLLHNETSAGGTSRVDDLIAIHGFDILLENEDAFERHRRRLERVAAETGKTLVPVRMNLRRTRLRELSMGGHWHGSALAAIGLFLGNRYERLLIAASEDVPDLGPWGSHPQTDPLLSSTATTFVHDGTSFTRWDKLAFLVNSDVALRSLRVCSRDTSGNCGDCEKCYRNMIILDALGSLGRATTFPARPLDLERVSRIFVRGWRTVFYDGLKGFLISRGRPDLAAAIERSLRRSRWRRPVVRVAKRVGRRRYVGRAGRWLQKWALEGYLR
jgi:hypothetical protein